MFKMIDKTLAKAHANSAKHGITICTIFSFSFMFLSISNSFFIQT